MDKLTVVLDKTYHIQHNVGKSKYIVSYHNGKEIHRDGSPFFAISIFKNKVQLAAFISKLKNEGYYEGV